MAAPAALGVLGKHIANAHLDASGVSSMMDSQKERFLSAVPAGLHHSDSLGLVSLASIGHSLPGALQAANAGAHEVGTAGLHLKGSEGKEVFQRSRCLTPLLLAVLVIGLVWYFARGCRAVPNTAEAILTDTVKPTEPAVAAGAAIELVKVKLPGGVELDAYKGGIEDQLVSFLNDPLSKAGNMVWFDFDNLNFATGSAEIIGESQKQIQNITAILKSYPKIKTKVGGYTDRTGDSAFNLKLSKERAAATVKALDGTGSPVKQIVGSDGYGSQFAKAAADAPDPGRKRDRRISISVREK